MSESKRFYVETVAVRDKVITDKEKFYSYEDLDEIVDKLNEQQSIISKLEEEKGYWKGKAMTLLMQVRRLTPLMTDKEVMEFSKELEDE